MALTTDFNVDPYYDDYDQTDGFYRILFRPGYAVQAREVTQLQTILQKQIERHGSHVFDEGSIVFGCELNYDNEVKSLKLETQFSGVDLTIAGGTGITTSASSTTVTATIDAAQTGITSLLATDIKIGEDDQTKIDFETADTINFYAGNENQLVLTNGYLTPSSNANVDLGTDALEFKDLYIDGTAYIDTLSGCVVDGGSY